MAYIGKQPIVGNFQVCDAISVVNGQAAYTMQVNSANVEPENANHMLVSLNGILQKPGSSFTISGATITFASNLATGDVIDFIILLGDTLNVGTPSDDSVGAAQIADDAISDEHLDVTAITGQTAETSVADDDLVLVSDTSASAALRKMTVSNLVANAGGNTPGFQAYASSDQTGVSDSTWTKVNLGAEIYDSDNKFGTTSSRFTPTVAGYYHCFASVFIDGATDNVQDHQISIYKNGSSFLVNVFDDGSDEIVRQNLVVAGTIYLDADDYIELYAFADVASGTATFVGSSILQTHMGAFKVA
tara:strand:- start:14 stop:922 length:909 start_codon:yes stop_codon:yes gene_type:complete